MNAATQPNPATQPNAATPMNADAHANAAAGCMRTESLAASMRINEAADCIQTSEAPRSLVVFSDDWGRHPSSCQHLVRHLMSQYTVLWVNTIGTRAPRLDMATLSRLLEKMRQWAGLDRAGRDNPEREHSFPQFTNEHDLSPLVANPWMWPWFGRPFDRALNRKLLMRQLSPLIRKLPQPVCGLTTLPITADLPGRLPVDRWVYYCVDDFSLWPGLDRDTLRRMDVEMIRRADEVVAVSENLQQMIAREGRDSQLLTHGVDVDFWQQPTTAPESATCASDLLPAGAVVFWGVIDRRMDVKTVTWLARDMATEDSRNRTSPGRRIVLIGPQQDPDPDLLSIPNVILLPPQPLNHLPAIAAKASVLIMPYADLPVTRAMQPLKLKEYLATGRPVVVNRLPSTLAWSESLDVASTPAEFSAMVRKRIQEGITAAQLQDRRRLQQESWSAKADILNSVLCRAGGRCEARPDEYSLSPLSAGCPLPPGCRVSTGHSIGEEALS